MKKAIRYLRFSHDGQSNSSIEKQDLYTGQWLERNRVELIDTFIDAGYSARTFDRPDFIKLQEFITKHHQHVDYLVVDQMDRFSRDAGEAMSLAKKLQLKFSIQIVSVTEGITFDYHTPGSFFRAGLQLLLAEDDNINRANKVNGGIYTAKAKEGRYIHSRPPYGYDKVGKGKEKHIVINEPKAAIVRFIFHAYLHNTPMYLIRQQAKEMGMAVKGKNIIRGILDNPVYAGRQVVKPFKELPGGVFPAKHEAIIGPLVWEEVQRKLKKPEKERVTVLDEIPLRGVLKCHCGALLTGAPSRGRHGKYYYYYKCNHGRHNNISAVKAHQQMERIMELISLPQATVTSIREKAEQELEQRNKENKLLLAEKKAELAREDAKLFSVEEKWISNTISHDTYNRWYTDIMQRKQHLKALIDRLSHNQTELYRTLYKTLDTLTDLKYVYNKCDASSKQELLRLGFDSNLYYEEGIYRTPTMLEPLAHNVVKMDHVQKLWRGVKSSI